MIFYDLLSTRNFARHHFSSQASQQQLLSVLLSGWVLMTILAVKTRNQLSLWLLMCSGKLCVCNLLVGDFDRFCRWQPPGCSYALLRQ